METNRTENTGEWTVVRTFGRRWREMTGEFGVGWGREWRTTCTVERNTRTGETRETWTEPEETGVNTFTEPDETW